MSIQTITSHVTRFTLIATNLGTKRGKNHSYKNWSAHQNHYPFETRK